MTLTDCLLLTSNSWLVVTSRIVSSMTSVSTGPATAHSISGRSSNSLLSPAPVCVGVRSVGGCLESRGAWGALSMPQAEIAMSVTSHIITWKQEEKRRQSYFDNFRYSLKKSISIRLVVSKDSYLQNPDLAHVNPF